MRNECDLVNIGWTDIARAASLAVRQAKAAARHAAEVISQQLDWSKERKMVEDSRKADAAIPIAPGPDIRQQTAAREEKWLADHPEWAKLFKEQAKQFPDGFIDNWYPHGADGTTSDPHFGESSVAAPYGFVDGTRTPRTTPLYGRNGYPIIPKPKVWKSFDESIAWSDRQLAAANEWGKFGEKKKWMRAHSGGTESAYKAAMAAKVKKRAADKAKK